MVDQDASLAATGWLDKAKGDLEAARALSAATGVPPWVAGLHLQQACEKCLKALQPFATDDRYPILSPREATLEEVEALLPRVGFIVEELEKRIGRSIPG